MKRAGWLVLGLVVICGAVGFAHFTPPTPEPRPQVASAEHPSSPINQPSKKALPLVHGRVYRTVVGDPSRPLAPQTDEVDTARVEGLKRLVTTLTPEELRLLELHPPETLSQDIFDAEQAYIQSGDGSRAARQAEYFALQNLASRLTPPAAPMAPEVVARYREYDHAVEGRRSELARLPPSEARQLQEQLKEDIISGPEKAAHASGSSAMPSK